MDDARTTDAEFELLNGPPKPKKPKAKKVPTKRKAIVKKLRKLVKKPKAKKKPSKLAKAARPDKSKKTKPARVIVRTERLDMRLSKAEKTKVSRIAKKLKRTLTSVVYEAIEKLK